MNNMLTAAIGGRRSARGGQHESHRQGRDRQGAPILDYGTKVINEFNNTTIQETVQAPFMGPSRPCHVLLNSHTQDIYGRWR